MVKIFHLVNLGEEQIFVEKLEEGHDDICEIHAEISEDNGGHSPMISIHPIRYELNRDQERKAEKFAEELAEADPNFQK